MLIRSGEAPAIGWSRNMLYSGFNTLPRSVVRRQTGFAARITRTLSGLSVLIAARRAVFLLACARIGNLYAIIDDIVSDLASLCNLAFRVASNNVRFSIEREWKAIRLSPAGDCGLHSLGCACRTSAGSNPAFRESDFVACSIRYRRHVKMAF